MLKANRDVSTDLAIPEERASIIQAMDEHWLSDKFVVWILKDVMLNSVTANPKTGEYYTDYGTIHQAIKTWHKMKTGAPDMQIQIANIFPTNAL